MSASRISTLSDSTASIEYCMVSCHLLNICGCMRSPNNVGTLSIELYDPGNLLLLHVPNPRWGPKLATQFPNRPRICCMARPEPVRSKGIVKLTAQCENLSRMFLKSRHGREPSRYLLERGLLRRFRRNRLFSLLDLSIHYSTKSFELIPLTVCLLNLMLYVCNCPVTLCANP